LFELVLNTHIQTQGRVILQFQLIMGQFQSIEVL